MRELLELKEEFTKTFPHWMSERDVKEKLDQLHTSREYVYVDAHGMGTYVLSEAYEIEPAKVEGKYTQELNWSGTQRITVYLEIDLFGWDEEEQQYTEESARIVGWDYE